MDPTRDLSRNGQENRGAPLSSELEDHLFRTYFDWDAYINDTEPSHPHTPKHLDKLITDIHPLIDSLESHRFFRMRTSFGSDDGAVVTSPEISGHPSPPELVQGEGSTSPSDHSGPILADQSPELSYRRPTVSLQDAKAHDDQWTYPRYASQSPPVSHQRLRAPPAPSTVRKHGHGHGHSHRAPKDTTTSSSHGKRPRQLENPDQTADVRKTGACLPCRISKTRCHENGICPTCRKAFPDHSHLVCARKNLLELWPVMGKGPDFWSKNWAKEAMFYAQPRDFTGKPKPIHIFFSMDAKSPALSAYVQPYRWKDEHEGSQLEKAAFCSNFPPRHDMLQQWAEQQIRIDRGHEFPTVVQKFLMEYALEGHGLPKHQLVEKVHAMSCFFRIWKTPSFWCRDPSGRMTALPISVQAQLRTIARRGIQPYERDILRELDSLTTPSHQPKPDDKMALWACLWQLILMYRELTISSMRWLAHSSTIVNDPHTVALQSQCMFLFDGFFPMMTIFYHYQFRTKKSLELSMDWLKSSKYAGRYRGKSIEYTGKALLDCRKHFLQTLQSSEHEVDRMLCVFVINHELKKLNARKRASKSSKSKGHGHDADDDCDYDAD